MSLLVIGVIIWSFAHSFPAVLPGPRDRLQEKLGENPYKGLFSLVIIASLVMIVVGWRTALPQAIYAPPLAPNPATSLLILIGLILFFASQVPGNIKRLIRHPQMTGTILWGVAHLLTNGDSRSIVLFGGLTVWAVVEIVMINHREGPREKPAPAAIKYDLIPAVIGLVVFVAVAHFHAALFGVAAIPG